MQFGSVLITKYNSAMRTQLKGTKRSTSWKNHIRQSCAAKLMIPRRVLIFLFHEFFYLCVCMRSFPNQLTWAHVFFFFFVRINECQTLCKNEIYIHPPVWSPIKRHFISHPWVHAVIMLSFLIYHNKWCNFSHFTPPCLSTFFNKHIGDNGEILHTLWVSADIAFLKYRNISEIMAICLNF